MEETKVCTCCNRELPLSMFHKNAKSPDGLQSYCKDCKSAISREYNAKRKEGKSTSVPPSSPTKAFVPSSTKKVYHLECLASISNKDLIEELKARGFAGKLEYVYKIEI